MKEMNVKIIPSLRKHPYLKSVGTFLIAIALILGTVACPPPNQYELTVEIAPTGAGTTTPTGMTFHTNGTVVHIRAVANEGYQFVRWSAPAGTFGNITDAMTTFTMPAQDVIVIAIFKELYVLTMALTPPIAGTTVPAPGPRFHEAGANITIKALTPGYLFRNWAGAPEGIFGNRTASTTWFIMPAKDVTITANVTALNRTITMIVHPHGAGTTIPPIGNSTHLRHSVINITAVANPGYRFVNWIVPPGVIIGNATAAMTTLIVPAPPRTVVLAVFEP
jgi:hypothetical protein